MGGELMVYEIPLTAIPQRFTVRFDTREIRITLRWKETHEGGWSLDLDDVVTNERLVHGLPLVTGVDLLEPYQYLEIPGKLFIAGDGFKEATRKNLGGTVKLFVEMDE